MFTVSQPVSFMRFLKAAYEAWVATKTKEEVPYTSLDTFVDWAEDYLAKENQPIQMTYPGTGIGLRLQQGQMVVFAQSTEPVLRDSGIQITRPQQVFGQGMMPDTSQPITGTR